jgi:hypothetical protein
MAEKAAPAVLPMSEEASVTHKLPGDDFHIPSIIEETEFLLGFAIQFPSQRGHQDSGIRQKGSTSATKRISGLPLSGEILIPW